MPHLTQPFPLSSHAALTNGRISFWPLDNTNGATLWVDGSSVDTNANTRVINNGNAPFAIGAAYGTAALRYFDGLIDEVGVWDRALSQTEVETLYNDGDGCVYPFSACVVGSGTTQFIAYTYDVMGSIAQSSNGGYAASFNSYVCLKPVLVSPHYNEYTFFMKITARTARARSSKKTSDRVLVGINGFGRIGRALCRVLLEEWDNYDIAVINDINPDIRHLAYLLSHDSLYGTLPYDVTVKGNYLVIDGKKKIAIYHEKKIDAVPWKKHSVSYCIDASGVHENIMRAPRLKGIVRNVIVTNSPNEKHVDRTVIVGVNENDIDPQKDFIISSSICDALALAPVMKVLDERYGVVRGFVTTLHPWLSYQNLLDGAAPPVSYPGYDDVHYACGRASPFSLLPKPTTVVSATCKVLQNLNGKLRCFSYRVPTSTVSSSDVSVVLSKQTTEKELNALFEKAAQSQKYAIFSVNHKPLVSIDFKGSPYSVVVDGRWTMVQDGTHVKLVLWYDNEWGYSSRVVDLVDTLVSKHRSR